MIHFYILLYFLLYSICPHIYFTFCSLCLFPVHVFGSEIQLLGEERPFAWYLAPFAPLTDMHGSFVSPP